MRSRRGLSSVVGVVFAIIALGTTVGYITYSMNVLDNYNQSVLARNQQSADTINEKFQVSSVTFVGNKLNVTVTNTGTLPINFTKIYITNSSTPSTTAWVKSYSLNSIIVPPANTKTNIGQGVNTWLNTNYGYNVKLVTSRGNIYPFFINSVSQQPLDVKVQTIPPTVSNQFDTTVLMTVTNNATNAAPITNLVPQVPSPNYIGCSPPTCTATLVAGPIPASYPVLQPGETATFRWQYTITGVAGNQITFTTGILNGGASNTATANVIVRDIVSSLTAGSALIQTGVGTSAKQNNTMFFHTETNLVPSSKYQAMPFYADTSGTTTSSPWPNIQFFTKNATTGTILMYSGQMNASFRYTNDKLPSGVSDNSNSGHMLHFNRNYCQTLPCDRPIDSTNGNNNCYNDVETNVSGRPSSNTNRPTVGSAYGVNGSNGANFNGVQWYNINADSNCNTAGSNSFSIAMWFKADIKTGYDTKQYIWRVGTGNSEYYEVAIGDGTSGNHGRVYFAFNPGSSTITCQSDIPAGGGYMDGKWHYLAAMRTGDYACNITIDGVSKQTSTGSGGDNNISPSGPVSIGRFPSTTGDCNSNRCANNYYGSLDDIMFWNNHALSCCSNNQEVYKMYHTNYGTGAFQVGFVLDKTDQNGVKLANIIPLTTKSMPFVDQEQWSSSTSTSPDKNYYWAGGNYTISVPQITLSPGQRLNYTFYEVSNSGLNAKVRLDDKNFGTSTGDLLSSFIQYPNSNATMPSYLQYNRCTALDIIVYNSGPYGSWVTYQGTRVSFDNIYGTDSYAGIIHYVNGSSLTSSQDSIFMPVGTTNTFEFYPIQSRPDQNGGQYCGTGTIPDGTFDMNLFISGYDEHGGSFLRQVPFGTVYVYG
ncbi:MAG: hypothetical protein ABI340_10460 [Nitrososphaera sp.]